MRSLTEQSSRTARPCDNELLFIVEACYQNETVVIAMCCSVLQFRVYNLQLFAACLPTDTVLPNSDLFVSGYSDARIVFLAKHGYG